MREIPNAGLGADVLAGVRKRAVRRVKPLLGGTAWNALRRLDPTSAERDRQAREREAEEARRKARARRARQKQRNPAQQTSPPPQAAPEPVPVRGLPRSVRALLRDLDPTLTEKPRSRVAVLAEERSAALVDALRARHRRIRITTVPPEADESLLHVHLSANGPYDLIVDAVADRPDPAALYRSVLFHLRRGGQLAVADLRPGLPAPQGLWPLLTRLIAVRGSARAVPPHNADEAALAAATKRVVVNDGTVVVKNATTSLAKLREAEIGPVLQIAGGRLGTVLEGMDAERFTPRWSIRDHAVETTIRSAADIDVPALSLREYPDVVCSPGQAVVKGNLLLPETYRHYLYPRLVNRVTAEIAPRFAQVKRDLSQAQLLPGSYFHFDSEWPGHFGHVLTEQTSRLWGWEAAKARHADLKILLGRRPGASGALPFERAILESVGVPGEDIVVIDKPVRVERLLAATPMFSMPQYVSPRIATIWDMVGQTVGAEAAEVPTPRRFFCGRERQNRSCHNGADVEQLFAESGFEIVFPEHLPFATQVAMFRNADVVAGYAGSALFTLAFCDHSKRVLMISPESYTANNEYLIAAVAGHEFDVFWSVADSRSLISSYTFDFDREGRHLRRLLAELASD